MDKLGGVVATALVDLAVLDACLTFVVCRPGESERCRRGDGGRAVGVGVGVLVPRSPA